MEPVFGVALAYLVFGEKLSPLQMMGAMGIVGATVSFSKSD
jgi:drug/metabolite transporter (DMT)-like permease